MGDLRPPYQKTTLHKPIGPRLWGKNKIINETNLPPTRNGTISKLKSDLTESTIHQIENRDKMADSTYTNMVPYNNSHPWGILFTVMGTVLLDFDADACQSPARAYLLDVTMSG